jgi:DNA polymerase III subunit gamma/tau
MVPDPAAESSLPAQSQSLYRKYRPRSFSPDQLVGQEHIARTLRNAIVMDRVAHAYLFCGPRGTGKTSTARLLAKAVNCQHPDPEIRPCNECDSCQAINSGAVVDIIEIDAASNRGVDDIRDLREKVRYAPTQLAVKFYIIDEAHQLTRDAFNAFLKTLEEPPPHVKFVLATTEADKLPDTVASRCQRFDFRRIPLESAIRHLHAVAAAEGITAEDEAIQMIARHATGSLRDALGLLDQLALYESGDGRARVLQAETVRQVLGLSRNDRLVGLVDAIAERDPGAGLRLITEASDQGEEIHQLNRQVVGYLRMLLHLKAGGSPVDSDDTARRQAGMFTLDQLAALVRVFSGVDAASNKSSYPQLPLELALVDAILAVQAPDETFAAPPYGVEERPATTASSAPSPPTPAPAAPTRPAKTANRQPATRETTPETPPAPMPSRAPAPANGALEHLVANWNHIRRDIKASNSRIAALLTSADPAAVTDDEVVLVAPYEFHRNKINEDSVRNVIEGVMRQYTGGVQRVVCVAPDDLAVTVPAAASPPAGATTEADESTPEPRATPGDVANDDPAKPASSDDQERVEAAKRIFEAREIDD